MSAEYNQNLKQYTLGDHGIDINGRSKLVAFDWDHTLVSMFFCDNDARANALDNAGRIWGVNFWRRGTSLLGAFAALGMRPIFRHYLTANLQKIIDTDNLYMSILTAGPIDRVQVVNYMSKLTGRPESDIQKKLLFVSNWVPAQRKLGYLTHMATSLGFGENNFRLMDDHPELKNAQENAQEKAQKNAKVLDSQLKALIPMQSRRQDELPGETVNSNEDQTLDKTPQAHQSLAKFLDTSLANIQLTERYLSATVSVVQQPVVIATAARQGNSRTSGHAVAQHPVAIATAAPRGGLGAVAAAPGPGPSIDTAFPESRQVKKFGDIEAAAKAIDRHYKSQAYLKDHTGPKPKLYAPVIAAGLVATVASGAVYAYALCRNGALITSIPTLLQASLQTPVAEISAISTVATLAFLVVAAMVVLSMAAVQGGAKCNASASENRCKLLDMNSKIKDDSFRRVF